MIESFQDYKNENEKIASQLLGILTEYTPFQAKPTTSPSHPLWHPKVT